MVLEAVAILFACGLASELSGTLYWLGMTHQVFEHVCRRLLGRDPSLRIVVLERRRRRDPELFLQRLCRTLIVLFVVAVLLRDRGVVSVDSTNEACHTDLQQEPTLVRLRLLLAAEFCRFCFAARFAALLSISLLLTLRSLYSPPKLI